MSQLKDLITEAPVHERGLEIKTYPLEEDRIITEGWLRDERFMPGYGWEGTQRPPEVVHWMCVRLLMGGWPLSILDAEAEMPGVPHELCPTTLESVKKVVGMNIVSGYSEQVMARLGGIKGCAHLTHLIVAMGPAALHGYWAQRSRKRGPVPRSLDQVPGISFVINSCQIWKEDGPLIRMIKEKLEDQEGK